MLKNLCYFCLCLPLMACQISEKKPIEKPEAMPAVAPVSQSESVQQVLDPQDDEAIKALFEQKRIDPLTKYLEQHQEDKNKHEHVALVREERDKRCKKIAVRYEKKEPTKENLKRLKGGYAYSCMPLVVAFEKRVALATTAPQSSVDTPEKLASDEASSKAAPANETDNNEQTHEQVAKESTTTQTVPIEQKALPAQEDTKRLCQQGLEQNNHTQIAKHCPPIAQQGDVKSQLKLAKMYANGKSVPQSDQQAVKWYQMAAKQGNKTAQSALGVSYYTGNGVTQDYRKAASWQRKAANQGHPEAQFILGVMYELGQGVPQDFVLAYKWFLLATSQGAKGAMESRGSLAAKLSPEQIQEGQRLAREWSTAN